MPKKALDVGDYGSGPSAEWRTFNWRRHLKQVELNGTAVNCVDVDTADGTATPVVFVHGLGGCWQNWVENIPYFARSRRVLALDLPGFGGSQLPLETVTIPLLTKTVAEFCRQAGLGQIDLVGNSMGGLIAADLAAEHGDIVRRLVLVSAAGFHATSLGRVPLMPGHRLNGLISRFAEAHRGKLLTRPRLRQLVMSPVIRYPNRLSRELLFEQMGALDAPGFTDALLSVLGHDISEKIDRVKAQTLIVWGKSDKLVPASCAEKYGRAIEGSQKVVFDQTGHVPMLERPARFNRMLDEFLTG